MGAGLTPSAPRDARARVGDGLSLGGRLLDAVRFAARPTFVAAPMPWGWGAAAALVAVFVAACLLDALAWRLITLWDGQSAFLLPLTRGYDSPGEIAFKALLLAPVVEEALFRGWMSGRAAALRFAALGIAAHLCFLGSLWASEAWRMALDLGGIAIAFFGLFQWLSRRERERQVPGWFVRHFHWLVWGSSLVFALIHLGNYGPLTDPRGVLVVSSQLIGGLTLAYVRTRIGLVPAMAYHAAYNALLLIGGYLSGAGV